MCVAPLYVCVCSAGNSSNWALLHRLRACLTEASQRGSVAITLATGHSAAGPHPPPVPHLRDEILSVHVLQPEQPLSLSLSRMSRFLRLLLRLAPETEIQANR